jgi:hypothetical protein
MLRSPTLPPAAKKWIAEYASEKLSGAYGHSIKRLRIFRAQVAIEEMNAVVESPEFTDRRPLETV